MSIMLCAIVLLAGCHNQQNSPSTENQDTSPSETRLYNSEDDLPHIDSMIEEPEAQLFEFILLPISTGDLENKWETVCNAADICHFRTYQESGFGFVEDPAFPSNYVRIELADSSSFNTVVGVRQVENTSLQVRITDIGTVPRFFTGDSVYASGKEVNDIETMLQYLTTVPSENTTSKSNPGKDLLEKVFLPIANGEIENSKAALMELVEQNRYFYHEAEGLFSVAVDPDDYKTYIFGTPYLENRSDVLGSLGIHFIVNGKIKEAQIRYYQQPVDCIVLIDEETMEYQAITLNELEKYFFGDD